MYLLFLTMFITTLDPMMHTDGYKVLNLTTGEYMALENPRDYFPVQILYSPQLQIQILKTVIKSTFFNYNSE